MHMPIEYLTSSATLRLFLYWPCTTTVYIHTPTVLNMSSFHTY